MRSMRSSPRSRQRGWVQAAIAGAAALAGGVMGNSASAAEAAKNRGFQQAMYERRYQYAMNDMRAAGINPMLAGEFGGGGAPSGATASQQDPITPAVNSALAARMQSEQVKQVEAQTKNIESSTAVNEADKIKKMQEAINLNALTEQSNAARVNLLSSAGQADAEQTRIGYAIKEIEARIKNLGITGEKMIQETKESYSREDLNKALTMLRKLEQNEYKANSEFYGNVEDAAPAVKFLLQLLKGVRGK